MRLSEYSMWCCLRNVTGLPKIFYVILAQYSEATVSPIKMKVSLYLFSPVKVVGFEISSILGLINALKKENGILWP